jgi:hypothetical protein
MRRVDGREDAHHRDGLAIDFARVRHEGRERVDLRTKKAAEVGLQVQTVGLLPAVHSSVAADSEENPPAERVGEGCDCGTECRWLGDGLFALDEEVFAVPHESVQRGLIQVGQREPADIAETRHYTTVHELADSRPPDLQADVGA